MQTSRLSAKSNMEAEGSWKKRNHHDIPTEILAPPCCLLFKLTAAFRTFHPSSRRGVGAAAQAASASFIRFGEKELMGCKLILSKSSSAGPRNRQRIRRGNLQVEEQERWSSLLQLRRSIGSSTQSRRISGKMSCSLAPCQLVSRPWFFSATWRELASERQ